MDIFTPEEIEAFAKKVLVQTNEDEFIKFYEVCAEKAKEETKFQISMFYDRIMHILMAVVLPVWGPIDHPTDRQIALMNLTAATCHQIFDLMLDELMEKNKTKAN